MKIFTTRLALSEYLTEHKAAKKKIALVPTMGALHAGHLSLIDRAGKEADLVVCSIFVNPTQFNDPADLAKYPRPVESDVQKLEAACCDVLFMPEVSEMYDAPEDWFIDLHGLDNMLEGKIRPGHYQGVTQIVKKLFDTVQPDIALFGQKDYQQIMVISELVRQYNIPVRIIMCPIIREQDGLALSSRNVYLSAGEHRDALALSKALNLASKLFPARSIEEIKDEVNSYLRQAEGIEPEYFEICDSETFLPATEKNGHNLVALVAARVGSIRLIDNVILQ